jgi:hypothetical protein
MCKEVSPEVNIEKTKYMFISCHQTAVVQNNNTKDTSESFEEAEKFEYFGTMVTNQNCIHKEIRCR